MFFLVGCSAGTAKHHFLQAEKFWFEQKYEPSVSEFEKAAEKDPKGKLGLYARFRAAEIRWLYLFQDLEALQAFRSFLKDSTDSDLRWQASLQMGEILYFRLQAYEQAYLHYKELIKKNPTAKEAPEILFRMGKAQFFLWNFEEAKESFELLMKDYPHTTWAEKAHYETVVSDWMAAERLATDDPAESKEAYKEAMLGFQKFLSQYPESSYSSLARFGIAAIYESNENEAAAVQSLETLLSQYPSKKVILLKLARIKGRQKKRGVLSSSPSPIEGKGKKE